MRLELRIVRPQDHRAPGGFADRRAIQFHAGLGHSLLKPGDHEGHRAFWRQRVNPQIPVPATVAAATPVLQHHQLPPIVTGPRMTARGRGAAPIGIHDPQPQSLIRRPCSPPPPVPFQGIAPARSHPPRAGACAA